MRYLGTLGTPDADSFVPKDQVHSDWNHGFSGGPWRSRITDITTLTLFLYVYYIPLS